MNNRRSPIKISIITPTWNRGLYLSGVYQGLTRQKFTFFEWIVGNDGSNDQTTEILTDLAKKSSFKITLVNFDKHVGKPVVDNACLSVASGDMVIWNDSDYIMLPGCLNLLFAAWEDLDSDKAVGGITAQFTKDTATVTPLDSVSRLNAPEVCPLYLHFTTGSKDPDRIIFVRRELLLRYPFPEVDFVVPEGAVWSRFYLTPFGRVDASLMVKRYNSENNITFAPGMKFCRGRAVALALKYNNCKGAGIDSPNLWDKIILMRLAIHGELTFNEIKNVAYIWISSSDAAIYVLAWIHAMTDKLRFKIQKTHREFIVNKPYRKPQIIKLN